MLIPHDRLSFRSGRALRPACGRSVRSIPLHLTIKVTSEQLESVFNQLPRTADPRGRGLHRRPPNSSGTSRSSVRAIDFTDPGGYHDVTPNPATSNVNTALGARSPLWWGVNRRANRTLGEILPNPAFGSR